MLGLVLLSPEVGPDHEDGGGGAPRPARHVGSVPTAGLGHSATQCRYNTRGTNKCITRARDSR